MENFWIRDLAADPCSYSSCTKKATKVVMNRSNASLGSYCAPHAKQRVRDLGFEQRRWEERQAASGASSEGTTT